ncbi:carbamoyltransferase family protein [Niabella sp. 22666]|uniref:carbamoyltransferase family protein n=1 Tax=Niabella sp. 22666 TaxID=3453954 RepID=UPI003F878EDA
MYTLGINAAFHDSAACLVKDGQLIAAAEEERFTQIKHGKRPIPFSTYELPFHAIFYCLETADIHINDIDFFSYSFDPHQLLEQAAPISLPLTISADNRSKQSWDALFLTYILNARFHLEDGYPHHLQQRFKGARIEESQWRFTDHHLAHAASAFLPSPFEEAAIMVTDGRGEQATTSYSIGKGSNIQRIGQVNLPHSLGLLYEKITIHLGFQHSSDEYRVMALASYGEPTLAEELRQIIQVGEHGQYTIRFDELQKLLGEPKQQGSPFTQLHFNIARSLQVVLQEKMLELCTWLQETTGQKNLCLAGGVALNCVLNAFIRDAGIFENIWVQPAAGDAGTALGAALWTDAQEHNQPRSFEMTHAYWGPDYSDESIETFLKENKIPYRRLNDIAKETAAILAQNRIIGWFQGRMEFGPRALGSRSILASPIDPGMQAKLNVLKDREDFRPVAPVVLEDKASHWFEAAHSSPFMLFTFKVKEAQKEKIPAVCHVDGTARIQTVNRQQHALYHDVLSAFHEQTGIPILVNTSFNSRGKPIVCTPRDAIECFWSTPFDDLIIGSFHISKQL